VWFVVVSGITILHFYGLPIEVRFRLIIAIIFLAFVLPEVLRVDRSSERELFYAPGTTLVGQPEGHAAKEAVIRRVEMTGSGQQTVTAEHPDIVRTLKTLIIEHSLPLWSREGWDPATGGFVEKLDIEGRADRAAPRRVRVQARQIYCFAKSTDLGWFAEGREIATKGLEYLLAKAKSPDGRPGFVHLLDPNGSVINSARDTYDHAFVLLALSTVYRLNNDAQVRHEIESLLTFLDTGLRSPHGGFLEGVPSTLPRRQNPQMHLFEAMIATFDATGDPMYQNRAGDLYGLFVANLYDPRRQNLGEYFEDVWSKIEPVCVEPGHQAEWVWLLKGFERITGCPTGRHRAELLA